MSRAPVALGLMCKPPRAGISKTRLAASIGAEAAARLSRAFLQDCARAAIKAAGSAHLDLHAFFRPADGARELTDILGADWQLTHADAGELGATMIEVLEAGLQRCPGGAMIMGADMPLLTAEFLVEAADSLRAVGPDGVVIIPSLDGGYCLLGLSSAAAAKALCAPMAWSTPTVLEETLKRAKDTKLNVCLLPAQRDIDERADLDWLLAQADLSEAAPFTASALMDMRERLPR
jgi:hypothetical protein